MVSFGMSEDARSFRFLKTTGNIADAFQIVMGIVFLVENFLKSWEVPNINHKNKLLSINKLLMLK